MAANKLLPETNMLLSGGAQWLITNGMGNLGTVLFAAAVGNNFDFSPKKLQFYAYIGMNIAALISVSCSSTKLEPIILTPLRERETLSCTYVVVSDE